MTNIHCEYTNSLVWSEMERIVQSSQIFRGNRGNRIPFLFSHFLAFRNCFLQKFPSFCPYWKFGMQKGGKKTTQGVLLRQNCNTLLNQALQQRGIDITTEVVNLLSKRCMSKIVTSVENMSNARVKEVFSCNDPQDKSKVLCMPHLSSSSSLGKICGHPKNSGPSKFHVHVISWFLLLI